MRTFLIIIAVIAASILTYLGFYNSFYIPKITESNEGGEQIVYLDTNGEYEAIDSVMKVVFNELYEKNGIVITKGFSLNFYKQGEEEMQISSLTAGCIINEKDSARFAQTKIDPQFRISETLNRNYIVTDFPLKGKMSIFIGMKKVYPRLNEYCIENGYRTDLPVWEIYDREEKKIHYRRELIRN